MTTVLYLQKILRLLIRFYPKLIINNNIIDSLSDIFQTVI